MAQIIIDIPDNIITRVIDAITASYGFDNSTGETEDQFIKHIMAEYIKNIVRNYEAKIAEQQAEAKVNNEILII